ncbi:MAG: bifunctional metallophosphatase/5'-nucleotidase [Bifidobacteriaceae bacterium]|jgi:2',3'-cyclic-nucleotide 2'-phosphodiesterase (5'-nucleotidase family)|nr:bifunctional metallophosphatase/5'-nucleotidase [Bifidobacteriaceae bacterium]
MNYKKIISIFGVLSIAFLAVINANVNAQPETSSGDSSKLRILFTHDLHSHFQPFKVPTKSANSDALNIIEVGGYAGLSTLLKEERASAEGETLTLDGGDFSMGTVENFIFREKAPDLTYLAALGYDATTLGNHEFDYGSDALAESITNAKRLIKSPVPILTSNIVYDETATDSLALKNALQDYGSSETMLIEKGDFKIGLFGVMGKSATNDAPLRGSVNFTDIIEASKIAVQGLKEQGANMIIALSHSGTNSADIMSSKSEDVELARNVEGIDFILSAHTHSYIDAVINVNGTKIASVECYGRYLGRMDFEMDENTNKPAMIDYATLEVSASVAKDPEIQKLIDDEVAYINSKYLSSKGFSVDEKLGIATDDLLIKYNGVGNEIDSRLGRLINAAYLEKVAKVYAEIDSANEVPTIAVSAQGAIRDSLFKGDVTYEQVFNVVGLGEDYDDQTGYPLSVFYITGNDLFSVAEVDSSISGMLPQAKLFFSGMRYHTSSPRMFLNTVTSVEVQNADGNWSEVTKDKLYPVVANSYLAEMMGIVSGSSFNILNIALFDNNGQAIKSPADTVIKYTDGSSVKEWEALVDYIPHMPESTYETLTQKLDDGFTLSGLFANWNAATYALLAAVVLVVLLITGVIAIVRHVSKRRKRRLVHG